MSYFRSPLDCPTRYQWDADSRLPLPDPGTAPGNCGMTCAAHVGQYYTDKFTGIYRTRRLATDRDWEMSTTVSDQSLALEKLGVPNVITRPNLDQIHRYLATHRRPIIVGLDMSRVPDGIRGHPFEGSHAIELRANAHKGDVLGASAMDPNFNRTYRTDPTGGRRFYPDWVLQSAYYNAGKWAILPLNDKVVPPPFYGRIRVRGPGVSIRESAREIAGNVWAKSKSDGFTYRERDDKRLFANSYQYWWDGEIRKDADGTQFYLVKTHAGDTKFIRTGAAIVVRKP